MSDHTGSVRICPFCVSVGSIEAGVCQICMRAVEPAGTSAGADAMPRAVRLGTVMGRLATVRKRVAARADEARADEARADEARAVVMDA